jgi:hypothetical protein
MPPRRAVATSSDGRPIALGCPTRASAALASFGQWRVKDKLFGFPDPVSRPWAAMRPEGPILTARVEHFGAKDALLANDERVVNARQRIITPA